MDQSLAQALNSLMPALTGSLPPELLELAISLLAQSRSKASSLKADEEIARSYACANIACERLKQTLALTKIQPRPPCPPKVYQKLYKYLDSILPSGTRRSTRATFTNDPVSVSNTLSTKPRAPSRAKHVRPDISKRKTPQKRAGSNREFPTWVMPIIRHLCNEMSAPAAPHHIFAGVSSIVSSQDLNQAIEINIPALIIAVFILVTTRLAGTRTESAEYARQRSVALEILKSSAGEDGERREVNDADVDKCTSQFRNEQWLQMDWFGNIPVGAGVGITDISNGNVDDDASGDDEAEEEQLLPVRRKAEGMGRGAQQYLQAGLGTMMRDQVDYLSDDRRRDYQEWKKGVLTQIDELEKSDGMDLETV